ncbi:hypothetical protein HMPREF0262_03672 [Clostridium sp. ATCC 29733]|nr:hypothetical protein HMPREF0262_03672 [Clostridium sp. ATCC 29733]
MTGREREEVVCSAGGAGNCCRGPDGLFGLPVVFLPAEGTRLPEQVRQQGLRTAKKSREALFCSTSVLDRVTHRSYNRESSDKKRPTPGRAERPGRKGG